MATDYLLIFIIYLIFAFAIISESDIAFIAFALFSPTLASYCQISAMLSGWFSPFSAYFMPIIFIDYCLHCHWWLLFMMMRLIRAFFHDCSFHDGQLLALIVISAWLPRYFSFFLSCFLIFIDIDIDIYIVIDVLFAIFDIFSLLLRLLLRHYFIIDIIYYLILITTPPFSFIPLLLIIAYILFHYVIIFFHYHLLSSSLPLLYFLSCFALSLFLSLMLFIIFIWYYLFIDALRHFDAMLLSFFAYLIFIYIIDTPLRYWWYCRHIAARAPQPPFLSSHWVISLYICHFLIVSLIIFIYWYWYIWFGPLLDSFIDIYFFEALMRLILSYIFSYLRCLLLYIVAIDYFITLIDIDITLFTPIKHY